METTEFLQIIFSGLIWKLPIFIVLFGGAIYCVVNYSKYQKINRLVLSGIVILLVLDVISLFLPILHAYLFKHYGTGGFFSYAMAAIGFVMSLGYAAGLGLILYAVWANREQK